MNKDFSDSLIDGVAKIDGVILENGFRFANFRNKLDEGGIAKVDGVILENGFRFANFRNKLDEGGVQVE